ncbi:MAG TPA: hypothetical protein DCO70_06580 [Verrucomicrobiales bacterium]|nr:hypothetical protein [Verrucomicrobiales bacterium]
MLGPNAGFVLNGDLHVTGNDSILFEDQSVFYSDIKLKHNLTKADPIITLQPDKKNSFIRFIGTSIIDQGNGAEDKIESNYIFVGDDLEFKRGASVGLYGGGDIVAAAKSIRMSEFSGLLTVSPTLNKGGDIKLTADHILMEDTLLETSAQAGVGGDIYLIADDIEINDGGFGTFSYYSGKANSGRAGSSTLKARDSLRLNSGKIHSISFTSAGGSGNIEVDTGELIMDGGTLSSPAEFKSVAYRGSTGNVLINASKMRTSNARFQVEALQDLNYVPTSENYGDLKIKAEEADFGVLSIIAATRQKNGSSDILIDVSGDLGLGKVTIQGRGTVGDNEGGRSLTEGVGGNLIINAKNIFGQTDYIKGQGQQLRIFSTGSIHLNAEEKIHLGKAIFGYDNISPKRRHEVRMTADEIQLGFKPEQNPNKTASVEFDYDFEKNMSPEIFLNAQNNLRINPGAIIKASQFGISAEESILQDVQLNLGWGGDHLVKGKGSLQLAGSTMIQINASGVSGGWQKAGTLKFHSQKLIVDSDVSILSSTKGGEQSASLVLDAENFTLDGGLIQTVTSGIGRAGDVSLRANSSSIQNGGSLGSKTEGEGASGDIHVEGGRLVLDGESSLRSGVDLNAEEMSLDAIGDAGAVTINVESISLSGGSYVASTALDVGQSKDVNVKAGSIILGEQSYITSTSQVTEEVGAYRFFEAREERELTRNGVISLTGKAIELSSGSYLKTTTNLPYRQAGDIVIKGESIVLAGGSAVVSNTEPSGQVSEAMAALGMGDQTPNYGNAGTVEIEGHTVIVAGGSRVASDSFTDGDGGNVSIKADTLNLQDRGRIYAGALNRGGGGQISIETEKLNAEGQASIVADVRDSGQGGKVSIHADEMNLDQASVYGSTSGEGAGSRIQVQANELNLFNGARVESVAFGLGQAGGLDIAADTVSISGQSEWFDPKDVDAEPSGHVARSGFVTSTEARGAAGTIHLNTLKLDLDGGVISSASTDWGAAGSINIGISETILMRNHGQISVRSALANGGDITIQTDGHVLVDDSELSASAELDGGSVRLYGGGNFFLRAGQITAEAGQDGGNIFVEAPETLVLQKGRLSANAIRGQGGYILITANGFLPSIETSVTASSEFGVQGTVEIRSPDTDVGSSLVVLPDKLSSRSVNLAERCALRLQGDVSSFFMNGQGGLPVWSKENYLPETIQVRM